MNKLTQELAEQAAGNFTQNFKWEHLQQIDKDIFEKFAELIKKDIHRKLLSSILITAVVMEGKGQTFTSEDYILTINKVFGVEV